jgi:hypothetical protein
MSKLSLTCYFHAFVLSPSYMATPGDASTSKSQSSSNQPNQRRPAVLFEALPSIKIITPPKGQFSPKVDERCLTFCSQTVTGRIHRREPECYSICIRNVFAHEVRNVIAFKNHRNVDPKGNAKYPLPVEGQDRDTPEDSELQPPPQKETKYWEEGLYVWMSKSKWAAQDHMSQMSLDLRGQISLAQRRASRHAIWNEYQLYLKRQNAVHTSGEPAQQQPVNVPAVMTEEGGSALHLTPEERRLTVDNKWYGPIIPPHPGPDLAYQAYVFSF